MFSTFSSHLLAGDSFSLSYVMCCRSWAMTKHMILGPWTSRRAVHGPFRFGHKLHLFHHSENRLTTARRSSLTADQARVRHASGVDLRQVNTAGICRTLDKLRHFQVCLRQLSIHEMYRLDLCVFSRLANCCLAGKPLSQSFDQMFRRKLPTVCSAQDRGHPHARED